MNTIYKYPFQIKDTVTIPMPVDAKVLSIQVQDDVPTMWVFVETGMPYEHRVFQIYGTGHPISLPSAQRYIATIQHQGFVWHVFE